MKNINKIIALMFVLYCVSPIVSATHPNVVHCSSGAVAQWWEGASGPGTYPRQLLYYVQDDMWDDPIWWVALHDAADEINIALEGRLEISLAKEGTSGHDAALLPGKPRFAETGNNHVVNGASEIWFSENLSNPAFLAQSHSWFNSVTTCYKSESDLRFDPTFTTGVYWESDLIGQPTDKRDMAQVAVHEMGHGIAINHEWGKTSIMNNSYPNGGQAGNLHRRMFGALASKYARSVYGMPSNYTDVASKAFDLDINGSGSNGKMDWTDSIKVKPLGGSELEDSPNNSINKSTFVEIPYLLHNTSTTGGKNVTIDFFLVTTATNTEIPLGSKSVWAFDQDETRGSYNTIVPSFTPSGNHKWRYRISQSDSDNGNNTVDLVYPVWVN